jgi:serine/threonine protein kinase
MSATDEDIVARAEARLGSVLRGKYRLDRVLGIGGMATVYAATHRNGNEFAVKVLHPDLSFRAEIRNRFLREGQAAATVKHEGAVKVLDDDVAEDGSAFLVMELLRGETVEALWERCHQRLPLPLVAGIGMQLLDVLEAAHARGVIHRDIKPANLFLSHTGHVKVLDFGIARIRDLAVSQATQTGAMMGTPAFMAPEQAMARTDEIDAQTDVWSAGATLFTLASGRLVHEADNAQQIMIRAATTPAPSLFDVLPEAPPLLVEVIDRSLAFDKDERWGSAGAMREALRSACRSSFGEVPTAERLAEILQGLDEEATVWRSAARPPPHPGLLHGAVVQSSGETTPASEEPTQQVTQWLPRVPPPERPPAPMAELATAMPVSSDTLAQRIPGVARVRPVVVVAAVVGAMVVAGGAIGLGRGLDETAAAGPAGIPPAATSVTTATTAPTRESASSPPEPTPAETASAMATASVPAAPSTQAPAPATSSTAPRPWMPPTKPKKADCTYVDDEGILKVKPTPECLKR